jgi:carbon monoxide dehydrogenase subunit G
MGSVRNHTRIARTPDDVWKVVSDSGAITAWAPNIERVSTSGNMRHVEFAEGFSLEEEVVTIDGDLRRLQYRVLTMRVEGPDGVIEGPMPVDTFATVDVIEDGDGALVIWSTEITPVDDPGGAFERGSVDFVKTNSAGLLRGLKEYLER